MHTRSRRLYAICLLMLLLVVSSLLLGELIVRTYVWFRGWTVNCYATSLDLFQPHLERGNDLKSNFRLRSGAFRQSTNALGFRGPPLTVEKPAGVTRIAILGASSVFGYYANDGQEAARLLEAKLRDAGHRVEVINSGVPGYNLYQTASRFRQRVVPLQPDFVVLYLGWNDLRYVCSDHPERFRRRPIASAGERLLGRSALYGLLAYRVFLRQVHNDETSQSAVPTEVGRKQFFHNLERLATDIEMSGARMIVCTQCLAAHPSADDEVRRLVSHDESEFQRLTELAQWLHRSLKQFARDHQAELVDVYVEIPPQQSILADSVHLTRVGEQRLADLLAERISLLLQSPPIKARPRDSNSE